MLMLALAAPVFRVSVTVSRSPIEEAVTDSVYFPGPTGNFFLLTLHLFVGSFANLKPVLQSCFDSF